MGIYTFVLASLFLLACGAVSSQLLHRYKKSGIGFALGFFFGPIGMIVAAIMCVEEAIRAQNSKGSGTKG